MQTIEVIENTLWFVTNWRINILTPHSTLYWYSHQIRLSWCPDYFMKWIFFLIRFIDDITLIHGLPVVLHRVYNSNVSNDSVSSLMMMRQRIIFYSSVSCRRIHLFLDY